MAAHTQHAGTAVQRGTSARWLVKLGLALGLGIIVMVTLLLRNGGLGNDVYQASALPPPPVGLGIDMPAGAIYAQLPTGLRDYIRVHLPSFVPSSVSQVHFGIETPAASAGETLPAGLTDYLHKKHGIRTLSYAAAALVSINPPWGIDAPAGVELIWLPHGYREYIRSR